MFIIIIMNEILFWEKFRPKSLNNMVLLPRIQKFLGNGFKTNVLMYGHSGTGKTTLTRILLKNKYFKEINASLKNGVDLLREELSDFCKSMPSPLIISDDKMKYVYLEEFDKATDAFQDAFKAFIEEYNNRVIFIITMNHIENAIPEIRSRFNVINFNPSNEEERIFLVNGYIKYLKSICYYLEKKENKIIDQQLLKPIIDKNFPDLRICVQDLQQIYITGEKYIGNNTNNYNMIFDFMLNGRNDPIENFDFIENNFMDEPRNLLKALGKPFIKYIMENKIEIFKNKGFNIIKIMKEHNETYDNQMVDPIVHLSNYINELKKIII